RDAADWEFQWVTISPNRKYLDWSSWDRAMGYVKYEIFKERKAMAKTLADMTAEERAECVGTWADTTRQGLGVVVNATEPSDCWVLFPEGGGRVATCHNQRVTPRFDLPRAWTPDGEPELAQALAEETWEYSVQIKDHTGEWE